MNASPHSLCLEPPQNLAHSSPTHGIAGRDKLDLDTLRRTVDLTSACNDADLMTDLGEAGGKSSGTRVVAVGAYRNQANTHMKRC